MPYRALLASLLLAGGLLAALLPPAPHQPTLLSGRAPPGAVVRVKGTSIKSHADPAGWFALPGGPGRRWTASLDGFLIAGAAARRGATLSLSPLPADDNPDYPWIDPTPRPGDAQACGNCHRAIHDEWAGSAHARSATSPAFRRFYDRLLVEKPDGAGVCSSCHAPTLPDDDPAVFDLRQVRGPAALGAHCDYCHKVVGLNDGEIGLSHGRFLLRLLRPREGQLFFGPLDDVDRGEDAHSPFYRDSRYCAACHEGTVFGVPVYTTYSEWRDSPAGRAGQHCQSCHMRPTGKLTNVAPGRGGIDRDPMTLANHRFWDGDQLTMLRRCLELQVGFTHGPESRTAEIRLTARGVGHRVPTGFIERSLVLSVEALDAAGRIVGRGEHVYGRHLPGPFWREPAEPVDTRLVPDQPDVRRFAFPRTTASVRVRVVHRRFADSRSRELVVHDRTWPAR